MNMLPLLMTAAVSTRGMKGAMFSDDEREKMYAGALQFYCDSLLKQYSDAKIVFVENSGWDLDKIKNKLSDGDNYVNRIEFISLDYNDFDISRGKGYNEVGIIDQAIEKSKYIKDSKAFFKVTGRYPIYNIEYLLKKASKRIDEGYQLYGDVKDHKIFDWIGNGWCGHAFECRLFAITNQLWLNEVSPLKDWLDDEKGKLLEEVMFNALRNVDVKKSLRFKQEPHFGGIEGSDVNVSWQARDHSSLRAKIKRGIGNVNRIFLPWLWL